MLHLIHRLAFFLIILITFQLNVAAEQSLEQSSVVIDAKESLKIYLRIWKSFDL